MTHFEYFSFFHVGTRVIFPMDNVTGSWSWPLTYVYRRD